MRYLYVAGTLLLIVYGQLIVKWRVNNAGELPGDLAGKLSFVGHLVVNPWVISAFVASFLAAASWMMAMTHFSLSRAYPFMSLSFVLVMVGSALWLDERLSWTTVAGVLVIATGLVLVSQ